jgi:hypothetical protein
MPQLRRPLYQRSDGADEDRWRLVLDTDANRLFVEHEMKRGDLRGPGYSVGTDEMDLAAFLSQPGEAPHELIRLLAGLFENRAEVAGP